MKKYILFFAIYKLGKKIIEKYKFHQYKSPVSMKDVNISKIVLSKRVSFGKKNRKYFIDYKYFKTEYIYKRF